MSLVQFLEDPVRTRAFIADGVLLVDREVARKTGVRGMALKAGFKTVKAVRPGIVASMLEKLLPRFAPAVDPHYARAVASGDVRSYFVAHARAIAEDMLAVTDERAKRVDNRILLKVYQALRPGALEHTVDAMPGLAEVLVAHVGPPPRGKGEPSAAMR